MHKVEYKYSAQFRGYPSHDGVYPVVDMSIGANGKEIGLLAIVDTGAQLTLVSPEYAQAIDLNLTTGDKQLFQTARGGEFIAYGHEVHIRIFGEDWDSKIFFAESKMRRCLLGRDLLQVMQVGLKESNSTLFLF